MYIKNILIIILTMFSFTLADGLMLPVDENYPKDLLKNRMTHVTITINGIIAETVVYQEFVNEWYNPVDAVYSFPLPEQARATNFLYWHNDTLYQAVLKVKEQATNPGTGEGGIAADINRYIGRNGIKIRLKDIAPHSIQKIELHYISKCDYYMGKSTYTYPLNTKEFISYPYEQLQFSFLVNSNETIISYEIPDNDNILVKKNDGAQLNLELIKPKSYVTKDLKFSYQVDQQNLGIDFYSTKNDTTDGHFALIIRPENEAPADSIFAKRVFFLLSNSTTMAGYKLEESISAISDALDLLSKKDFFNIVIYNYNISPWKDSPVSASAENITAAKNYLSAISATYGWELQQGIFDCMDQIADNFNDNSILIFSDGHASIDPLLIESQNIYHAGIFPVAIGDEIDRARLEMTAALNYGFVTYIGKNDNIHDRIIDVYNQISAPVLKDTYFEFGRAGVSQIVPSKARSTYAGSYFFLAGRYAIPGESALSIAGTNPSGYRAYNFRLNYAEPPANNKFAESLWAKEKIDALEWQINVYGETDSLKKALIALSLKYNIRCRYTAYIADYQTHAPTYIFDKKEILPISFLAGNYPNPFNPETKIRFFIDQQSQGKLKFLKIYNILGQLVAVIDISNLLAGWHEVLFNGKDYYGNRLSSGVYFVQLQIQNHVAGTIRICMIK